MGALQSATATAINPQHTTVTVASSRRSATLVQSWIVTAPPGLHLLDLASSASHLNFRVPSQSDPSQEPLPAETAQVVASVEPLPSQSCQAPQAAPKAVEIDPAEVTSEPCYRHLLQLDFPTQGPLQLQVETTLVSGLDRYSRRRSHFEQAHALHARIDPSVYLYEAEGQLAPLQLHSPPKTTTTMDVAGRRLQVTATEKPPLPLAVTLALGPAVQSLPLNPADPQRLDAPTRLTAALLRASVELLLPHRDALALAVEAGSDFRSSHHLGTALVYQLYSPVLPYLPIGGHLDLGVACDLWQSLGEGQGLAQLPSLRCGPRAALALQVKFWASAPASTCFPSPEPPPESPPLYRHLTYTIVLPSCSVWACDAEPLSISTAADALLAACAGCACGGGAVCRAVRARLCIRGRPASVWGQRRRHAADGL
jgi:hypothetical protein